METISGRYDQALCFAAVAEAGSFTRAAERLDRSKAHVSKQVAALEKALGVQLLLRTTRRVALTEAGATYLDYCRQVREALAEGERAVSATREEVAGTLRLTAPTGFGDAFLVDLLLELQRRHPKLALHVDLSIGRRDLVADGYDFAIRTARVADERLVARSIGAVSEVPVASPAFLARFPEPKTPEDLAGVPCLVNAHYADDEEWVFHQGGRTSKVSVRTRFAANHYGMLRSAAVRGAGVVRLPLYVVAAALADGSLVRVLPGWTVTPTPVWLVYPQRRHVPHRNRVFRDFVVGWFSDPSRAAQLREP